MSEETLDAFFDKLVEVLINDVAFYIPSEIIPSDVLNVIQNQIPNHFLDELTILDIFQGMGAFEVQEFNKRIVKKPKSLENTIFQLLKKSKELEDFEFEYILKKYFDKVEFYTAIVNWLATNLKKYNEKNIDALVIGSFEIQKELYKTHFIELKHTFYAGQEIQLRIHYDLSELLKIYIPDLISRVENIGQEIKITSTIEIQQPEIEFIDNDLSSTDNSNLSSEHIKPKEKKKKEPLVSEKEAEEFLLTTVFNLKLLKIR